MLIPDSRGCWRGRIRTAQDSCLIDYRTPPYRIPLPYSAPFWNCPIAHTVSYCRKGCVQLWGRRVPNFINITLRPTCTSDKRPPSHSLLPSLEFLYVSIYPLLESQIQTTSSLPFNPLFPVFCVFNIVVVAPLSTSLIQSIRFYPGDGSFRPHL